MITVYRLEHKEWGEGIHTWDGELDYILREYLKLHENFDKYPTAYDDFVGIFKNYWYCCCSSLNQLFYWFSEEFIAYAEDYGFFIAEYQVREKSFKAGYSGKQCFFIKKESQFIKYYGIHNISCSSGYNYNS